MSISKHMSRVAAVGAAGAMGAVALVGIAPAADAATVKPLKTTYTCTTVGDLPTTVSIGLPTSAKAKQTKKGISAKSFSLKITLSEGIATALRGLTDDVAGTADGVSYKVGKATAKVSNVAIKKTSTGTSGPLVLTAKASGKQPTFKLKKKGAYTITAPKSFTFTPTTGEGDPLVGELSCALAAGAPSKVGTFKVK